MDATEGPFEFDLTDLERRLQGWHPSADGLDRDRMLYAAGRASARASRFRFASGFAAAFMTLVAVTLGTLYLRERGERRALLVALQEQQSRPAPLDINDIPRDDPPGPMGGDGYLDLRNRVLAHGLDAWPTRTARGSSRPPRDEPRPLTPAESRSWNGRLPDALLKL